MALTKEDLATLAEIIETGTLPLNLTDDLRQEMIWLGIVFSLRQDASVEAVNLLHHLVAVPKNLELAKIGFQFLSELALGENQTALGGLFDLAINDQNQSAVTFLKSHPELTVEPARQLMFEYFYAGRQDFPASQLKEFSTIFLGLDQGLQNRILQLAPDKGLRHWAILLRAVLEPDYLPEMIEFFPHFPKPEQFLCLDLLAEVAPKSSTYKNALCQLFIRYDFIPARDLVLESALFPDDPIQAALFFFLAEEWPRYEQIDFSYKLLSAAYEISEQPVRRKILAISRTTGQVDWIKALTGQSQMRWLKELSDAEWDSTIQALIGANRFGDAWTLAQASPPLFCGRILLALAKANWQPEEAEDLPGFTKLYQLALGCHLSPTPISPTAAWNSPAREISCIALDWDRKILAAFSSQTAILRWQLNDDLTPLTTLFNGSPGTNTASFSPDGAYLVIGSGDHRVRFLDLAKGMILKTLEGHKGLVRSLAFSPDGRFLYTASFDGSLQTWRFPNGLRHDLVQVSRQELFGLGISRDQKYLVCAGAEKLLWVYSLPGASLVRSLSGHNDTITLLAISAGENFAASYSRDLTLCFWNYASGKRLGAIPLGEPLTSLTMHPSGRYVLGGSSSGTIHIWEFPSGQLLHSLTKHARAVVGLSMSPDGDLLTSASTDGGLNLWDFWLFNISRTPLELLLPSQARIEKAQKDIGLPVPGKAWINFIHELILWRKRYDIEVADAHPLIHTGEFDIEL